MPAAADEYFLQLATEARRLRRPVAVDSGPLIDYLSDLEPTAPLLDILLQDLSITVVISTITLCEAVTLPAGRGDAVPVASLHQALLSLPALRCIDFDQAHAIETAFVRAETRLKLPDAAIVATARLADAFAILGNDRQWRHRPLGVPYHHMDDILALQ